MATKPDPYVQANAFYQELQALMKKHEVIPTGGGDYDFATKRYLLDTQGNMVLLGIDGFFISGSFITLHPLVEGD